MPPFYTDKLTFNLLIAWFIEFPRIVIIKKVFCHCLDQIVSGYRKHAFTNANLSAPLLKAPVNQANWRNKLNFINIQCLKTALLEQNIVTFQQNHNDSEAVTSGLLKNIVMTFKNIIMLFSQQIQIFPSKCVFCIAKDIYTAWFNI